MNEFTVEAARLGQPLLVVRQSAREMGFAAVDLVVAAIEGEDVSGQERLIRPVLSWEEADIAESL